jgi:hypothetical protein
MRALIEEEVLHDTRKLITNDSFLSATSPEATAGRPSLRAFSDGRTEFLLGQEKLKDLPAKPIEILVVSRQKPAGNSLSKPARLPRGKSPVVINEVMPDNRNTVRDPQGEYEDWIELYNRGDKPIDLSSWYLSDDSKDLKKWKFPSGTKIAAGGYLVVWADKGSEAPGLHANFKLSSDGETIWLADSESVFDQLKFPGMEPDKSFGKPDPNSKEPGLLEPTPHEKNRR